MTAFGGPGHDVHYARDFPSGSGPAAAAPPPVGGRDVARGSAARPAGPRACAILLPAAPPGARAQGPGPDPHS